MKKRIKRRKKINSNQKESYYYNNYSTKRNFTRKYKKELNKDFNYQ